MNYTPAMNLLDRLPAPPGDTLFAGITIATAFAAALVMSFDFVPILDHVNLAFHESGHVFFGIFGELMHWFGGTLGQFVFPLACTIYFVRQGKMLQAGGCAIWGFENLRYVAFYLGDARTQIIPLVGGGQHDWAYLLGRFGLLQQDQRIASFLTFVSWSGWVVVWGAVAWWWWLGRSQRADLQTAERRRQIIEAARERGAAQRERSAGRSREG